MQATLPVRKFNPGWIAPLALALVAAIVISSAVVFALTRPATPAIDRATPQAVEPALVDHRAGERAPLVGNMNALDQALADHRAGERGLGYSISSTPAVSERDDGLGSSIAAPSDVEPVWSGNPGLAEAGRQHGSSGNPGLKPQ